MSATIHFMHDQAWANARGIDDALRQLAAETPMAVDVPEPIPQPGYGHAVVFIVMGMGAFIGGVVIVALHVWGWLL